MEELSFGQKTMTIYCDNQSAIHLSKHQVYIKLHFVRDVIEGGAILEEKISTDHKSTNMLTKVIPSNKFKYCLDMIKVERR